MVGQGVLRECLLDPGVERVLAVGRSAAPQREDKLHELVIDNFLDFSAVERELSGYDACFFCLGISSAGMTEADYRRVTFDIALAAAQTLVSINPGMTFVFVSGAGADSTGRGRVMWARVKGQTENALLGCRSKASTCSGRRPSSRCTASARRRRGSTPRTRYSAGCSQSSSVSCPDYVTTTEQIGRGDARRGQTRSAETRARERRYQPAMMHDMLRAVLHGRMRRRIRGLSLCAMLVALAPRLCARASQGTGCTRHPAGLGQRHSADQPRQLLERGRMRQTGRRSARVRLLRHRLLQERRFRDRALHAVQARRLRDVAGDAQTPGAARHELRRRAENQNHRRHHADQGSEKRHHGRLDRARRPRHQTGDPGARRPRRTVHLRLRGVRSDQRHHPRTGRQQPDDQLPCGKISPCPIALTRGAPQRSRRRYRTRGGSSGAIARRTRSTPLASEPRALWR